MEPRDDSTRLICDGCANPRAPLQKLSLGTDFFGRPYDRLLPSSDLTPKWYCESCSVHKNLQRDFRDIQAEMGRWAEGLATEMARAEQLQRVRLRLREISLLVDQAGGRTPFLDRASVTALMQDLEARAGGPVTRPL